MKRLIHSAPLLVLGLALLSPSAFADFTWKDTEGKYRDLYQGDRAVARYVYEAIDESTPERREETYKPFYHIFQWWSKDKFITKGAGGKFTHHRGIYYGFSKCSYTDKDGTDHQKVDTWHCRKPYQIHKEFIKETAGKDEASLTTRIDWIGNDQKPFASEERTLTFSYKDENLIVKFQSKLTPLVPKLRVDGDPQHAGFQFRANNEVAEKNAKQTYYIRPTTGKAEPGQTINWSSKTDSDSTRDLPWKAMSYTLGGKRYSVLYVDSEKNPKPARFSERDYGRFGSYFVADMTPDEPLTVNYVLVIRQGEWEMDSAAKMATALKP